MTAVQAALAETDHEGLPDSSVSVHFGTKKSVREAYKTAKRISIENIAVPGALRKFAPMIELLSEHEDSFNQFLCNVAEAGYRLGRAHEARESKTTRKR